MFLKFANLKFKYKILISMTTITAVSLLFVMLFTLNQFFITNKTEAFSKAELSVYNASTELEKQLDDLIFTSSRLMLTPNLTALLNSLYSTNSLDKASFIQNISSTLELFINSQSLVSNVYFQTRDNQFFGVTSMVTNMGEKSSFNSDIWDCQFISFLPVAYDYVSYTGNVVPMIFPISNTGNYLEFKGNETSIAFVVLLNINDIAVFLDSFSNNYTSEMYIANSDGYPLNLTDDDIAFNSEIVDFVASSNSQLNQTIKIDNETYYISCESLQNGSVKLVHLIDNSSLIQYQTDTGGTFLLTWIVAVILCALLCLVVSDFLIRPMDKLTNAVKLIQKGQYTKEKNFLYTDEIGVLGSQINKMHRQILLQIDQIKNEERDKSKAEIMLLTEQVNPHFLYNTLSCIHFLILSKENDSASNMVESLGIYLRLTLNTGKSITSVRDEISHVKEYLNLMNRNSNKFIDFESNVEKSLLDREILKLILQPLAENSIKHGFSSEEFENAIITPKIIVEIYSENAEIVISVKDNGSGIDVDKAKKLINSSDKSSHFGLKNIYNRLCAFYGTDNVEMDFISIPFYENAVIIKFK